MQTQYLAQFSGPAHADCFPCLHQETRLALSRLCGARRSDRAIEIPPIILIRRSLSRAPCLYVALSGGACLYPDLPGDVSAPSSLPSLQYIEFPRP